MTQDFESDVLIDRSNLRKLQGAKETGGAVAKTLPECLRLREDGRARSARRPRLGRSEPSEGRNAIGQPRFHPLRLNDNLPTIEIK